jgi:hypothetical protein
MVIINYLFLGLSWNVFKIMLSLTCLSYLQSFSWLEISLVWIISIKNLRMLMWLREKYFMLDMVLICLKLFIYLMSTHYFPPWSVFHGDGVLVRLIHLFVVLFYKGRFVIIVWVTFFPNENLSVVSCIFHYFFLS